MDNNDDHPKRVDGLTGRVVSGPFGTGSKSQREAIWLEADGRRLVLKRKQGPAYGDRTLEKYVGKQVSCNGFIVGYMLIVEQIEVVPQPK